MYCTPFSVRTVTRLPWIMVLLARPVFCHEELPPQHPVTSKLISNEPPVIVPFEMRPSYGPNVLLTAPVQANVSPA